MSKFQIGDRVRLDRHGARNFTLKADITATVSALIGTDIRVKVPADHRDKFCIENYTYPSEAFSLVAPAPLLFRKGDKVLVEYTVECNQADSLNASRNNQLKVSAEGLGEHKYVSIAMLNAGSITRAPEPPYVPKPGDKFHFWPSRKGVYPPVLCIWIDDRGVVSENEAGERNYHAREGMLYSSKFDFIPA